MDLVMNYARSKFTTENTSLGVSACVLTENTIVTSSGDTIVSYNTVNLQIKERIIQFALWRLSSKV